MSYEEREGKKEKRESSEEGGEDRVARGTIEVRRTARRRPYCAPHPNAATPLIIVADALSPPRLDTTSVPIPGLAVPGPSTWQN